jgi:hypothetical protein
MDQIKIRAAILQVVQFAQETSENLQVFDDCLLAEFDGCPLPDSNRQ